MNPLNITPSSSSPFSSTPSGGRSPLIAIMVIILAVGTIGFGAATVYFGGRASTAMSTLNAQKAIAADNARADQKSLDLVDNTKANESPYRSYVAPEQYGSFNIKFPKDWSSSVDEEANGTQVQLIINPDFIRKTNGSDNPVAIRVVLIERTKDNFLSQYTSPIRYGTIKQVLTKVSSQPAYDLTGKFGNTSTIRMVVVPIRDKVLVFSTEDVKYASQFNEALAQATIIP
jgi:hypothetical protein